MAGQVHPDGTSSLVVLSGAVIVTPDHSDRRDQGVEVFRSGWGVRIGEDGIPSAPVLIPEPEIRTLVAALVLTDQNDDDEENDLETDNENTDTPPDQIEDNTAEKEADGNPKPLEEDEANKANTHEKTDDNNRG